MEKAVHEIAPVYDKDSKVLILGSFPSVKSREANFFYHHPQNRFWKLLAQLTETDFPNTIEEKKKMLLEHGIALWDVIASCEIEGSSDSSIRNVVVNDFSTILKESKIEKIFVNGGKAEQLYKKYCYPITKIEAVRLPSTSPANAACSFDKLLESWKVILLR